MLAEEAHPSVHEAETGFAIHFIVHGNFKLEEFLELVNERYPLSITKKNKGGVTTVDLRIRLSYLRLLIAILPKQVVVSYEPV